MICTNWGKGELQELTGTALLICPLCDSKLINPQVQPPDPWKNLTHQEKEQVMQFLEDAAKVKEQFNPESELDLYKKFVYRTDAEVLEVIQAAKDILPLANIWGREWFNQFDWAKLDRFKKAVEAIK